MNGYYLCTVFDLYVRSIIEKADGKDDLKFNIPKCLKKNWQKDVVQSEIH